jgi:hypothetical protein
LLRRLFTAERGRPPGPTPQALGGGERRPLWSRDACPGASGTKAVALISFCISFFIPFGPQARKSAAKSGSEMRGW